MKNKKLFTFLVFALFIFIFIFSENVSAALQTNLVSYYSFDSNANDDYSTNELSVADGSPTLSSTNKLGGNSYYYDGNDNHRVAAHTTLVDFSFSAWVYTSGTGDYGGFVVTRCGAGNVGILMRFETSGNICVYSGTGGWRSVCSSGTNYENSAWHHVVATGDDASGGELKLYIDNSLIGTTTYVDPSDGSYFCVGKDNDG